MTQDSEENGVRSGYGLFRGNNFSYLRTFVTSTKSPSAMEGDWLCALLKNHLKDLVVVWNGNRIVSLKNKLLDDPPPGDNL